jgi:hypothetical protein
MCRHKSLHHRRPRSLGGMNNSRNIVRVADNKHNAWHLLFSNWSPSRIAEEINAVWLDSDYRMEVKKVF